MTETTDNTIGRLAVLNLKIDAPRRRIASIEPLQRRPPQWQEALNRLADAREIYSRSVTQLDAFRATRAELGRHARA